MSSKKKDERSCAAATKDGSQAENAKEAVQLFDGTSSTFNDLVEVLSNGLNDVAVSSKTTVEDELQMFRNQWIAEVVKKSKGNCSTDFSQLSPTEHLSDQRLLLQDPSEKLFFREAYTCYNKKETESDASVAATCKDLVKTLQLRVSERGSFFELENNDVGSPTISDLPIELLSVIVRYVVGNELDIISLETLALVSSGFYLLARDSEIWYLICKRIFRITCDKMSCIINWRNMFLTVPHVYFHGVYIGKCSYIRYGETSFQDQFYRPCHTVVYYRHFRFFADGSVIMVTSSDHPSQTVPFLKTKKTRCSGALLGRYIFARENCIRLTFCRTCESSIHLRTNRGNRRKDPFIPYGVYKLFCASPSI
uniref:F-box domain-containing protein n=1 Tax=Syphacia muris TaxID=451379 RepID=A0A0N5B114_9BILA